MAVQAEITFESVPNYGDERPGAVVATLEVPPPPWEQQHLQQQQQQQRGGGSDRWGRSSFSSQEPPPSQPPQPLPAPPEHVGFFSKRVERRGGGAGDPNAATASEAPPRKHLSFNTPQAAAALLPVRAPLLPADLNEGYPDGWRATPYRASASDVVLSARAAGIDPLACDVVSFRSNLRPIFGCSFDHRKEWTVDAIVLRNDNGKGQAGGSSSSSSKEQRRDQTVFLEIVQHLDEGQGGRAPFPDWDRFFYYGFKFESLCFHGSTGNPSQAESEPVRIGRTEFNAVMVRELPPVVRRESTAASSASSSGAPGDKWTRNADPAPSSSARIAASSCPVSDPHAPLKLLVVAEMDGFDEQLAAAALAADAAATTPTPPTPTAASLPPVSSLVELKTLKWPPQGSNGFTLFNLKAPQWWLQCFMGGVEHLRLGGRDDSGILRSLDALQVSSLPEWARQSSGGRARWTAEGIVEHGRGVLDWVVRVARDNRGRHLRFPFKNGSSGGGGFGGGGRDGRGGRGGGGNRFGGSDFIPKSYGRITATEIEGGNLGERIWEALKDDRVGCATGDAAV